MWGYSWKADKERKGAGCKSLETTELQIGERAGTRTVPVGEWGELEIRSIQDMLNVNTISSCGSSHCTVAL